MGWLEDRQREQSERVHAMNPKVGDFVNLDTWFGDVWAEVLTVFEPRNDDGLGGSLVIARHRDDRKDTDYIFYHHVRKVSKRDDLTAKEVRIVYTKDHKYTDAFSREPGKPIEEFLGGFRASMRYRIINTKGVPIAEAKRIDTAQSLWLKLKDRESLILRDARTRMIMRWQDR